MDENNKILTPTEDVDTEDTRLYELGFHIVPMSGDEKLAQETDTIRDLIQKRGGVIVSEQAPKLMNLAYPMTREIDRRRYTYNTAYFGWFLFDAEPHGAHEIKEILRSNEQILRFLLIKTVKEAADVAHPGSLGSTVVPEQEEEAVENTAPEAPEVVGPRVDVEQIDAEIEKLVVE